MVQPSKVAGSPFSSFFSIDESVYDGYPSFMSNRSRATDLGLKLGVGWEPILIFTQKVQKKIRLKGKKELCNTRAGPKSRRTKIPVTYH